MVKFLQIQVRSQKPLFSQIVNTLGNPELPTRKCIDLSSTLCVNHTVSLENINWADSTAPPNNASWSSKLLLLLRKRKPLPPLLQSHGPAPDRIESDGWVERDRGQSGGAALFGKNSTYQGKCYLPHTTPHCCWLNCFSLPTLLVVLCETRASSSF